MRKHLQDLLAGNEAAWSKSSGIERLQLPIDDFLAVAENKQYDGEHKTLRNIRAGAVRGIAKYGPGAASAVPRLIKLLDEDNPQLVRTVVECLGKIGPAAAPAVPKLISFFQPDQYDLASSLGSSVAETLGSIGPGAKAALPALEQQAYLFRDIAYGPPAREIPPGPPPVPQTYQPGVDPEPPAFKAPPTPRRTTPVRSIEACFAAYTALTKINPPVPYTSRELWQQGDNCFAGVAGLRAFAAIEQNVLPRAEALQQLEQYLNSNPPVVEQIRAMQLLAQLEPDSAVSAEILLHRMHAHDGIVAGAAGAALSKFRPGCPEAARLLANGIADPSPDISTACCYALEPYGSAAKVALPILLPKLKAIRTDQEPTSYKALLVLLGAIGPNAKEAVPLLLPLLNKPDRHPRRAEFYGKWEKAFILYKIGQIGTPPELVPMITDILTNSEHPAELSAAMCAAGGLGEASEQLLPFFYHALQPDYPDSLTNIPVMPSPGYGYSNPFRKADNTSPTLEAIRAVQKMNPEKIRAVGWALNDLAARKRKEHREWELNPRQPHDWFKYSVALTVAEAASAASNALSKSDVQPEPPRLVPKDLSP